MTFPAPACVENHYGAKFERRTMTESYHVFQNQFYSFSRFVRSVDTRRNETKGIFNRGCTNCRSWTFSYYKGNKSFERKKQSIRTESCTTPNLASRTSSNHLKGIHRIFLVFYWKKCSFMTKA